MVGRPAVVSERVSGKSIGRRIAQRPELAGARAVLPAQMAEELAKIHAIPADRVPFLEAGGPRDVLTRLERELDSVEEPHPAIELGLAWAKSRVPDRGDVGVLHRDLRVGNLAVTGAGLRDPPGLGFAHLRATSPGVGG